MKLMSLFGDYTTALQFIIDNRLASFRTPWYSRYFPFAPPQVGLDFTSVIGRARIEAAASVVDRDSKTPLRSRAALEKLSGEIPAIKEMLPMNETEYRNYIILRNMQVDDTTRRNAALDLIFNDTRIVGESVHKRLDILCLQAVSTGKVNIGVTNNPDGLAIGEIDLLMPAANKKNAAVSWATSASATPITDITNAVNDAMGKGISFEKILMDRPTFLLFSRAKEVIDSLISYNQLQKGASIATLERVNEYLVANQLPFIEVVDVPVGVEKDGRITTMRPFETTNVSFIPSGSLGVIKNATAMESMQPVQHVTYASFNRALISKWSENEPWREFTKAELNAFPAVEAIDSIYLISHTGSF